MIYASPTDARVLMEDPTDDRVVRWPIEPGLAGAAPVRYKNQLAVKLSGMNPEKLVRSQVYLSTREMRRLYALAVHQYLEAPLTGTGIELGAGCALFSAVVSTDRRVQRILALEVCGNYATLVMPIVTRHVLGAHRAGVVVPVVGSFDDLRIPDNSLDFAIEIDSFHHSDDLARTLRECARVLKSGGVALCVDRCHPDSVTDAEVNAMLDKSYGREYLAANNYPLEIRLTRRENGEHEYRQHEWHAAFAAAGLELRRQAELTKEPGRRAALKGVFSFLPWFSHHAGATTAWLCQQLQTRFRWARFERGYAPRTGTVFVLHKP